MLILNKISTQKTTYKITLKMVYKLANDSIKYKKIFQILSVKTKSYHHQLLIRFKIYI